MFSWVTIDRICQEDADAKEDVPRELQRTGAKVGRFTWARSVLKVYRLADCGDYLGGPAG
jgi:hypothetical protein